MQKLSISFLGKDGPGVVATVSIGLRESQCDILQVTQTHLGAEFAAIYVVNAPDGVTMDGLRKRLEDDLRAAGQDISVLIREASEGEWAEDKDAEPYVATAEGPDGTAIIATLAKVFARHSANIDNVKAVLGHSGSNAALFVFEVRVPAAQDPARLSRELQSAARTLGVSVTLRHRDIFEALHRISD